jgi:multiple sugar transport system substrate-binding protein
VLASDAVDIGDYLASGRVSWISNPMSTYRKIQRTAPDSADDIAFWKTPAGPVRRLVAGAPSAYGVWQFARNQAAAVELLTYYRDHWVDAFKASTGFNCPLFPNILPDPVPILSFDSTSDPPDKLAVLETASEWDVFDGYPGPALGAVDEVADEYVVCDMMARAASGQMTPEDAVKWASQKMQLIYRKFTG